RPSTTFGWARNSNGCSRRFWVLTNSGRSHLSYWQRRSASGQRSRPRRRCCTCLSPSAAWSVWPIAGMTSLDFEGPRLPRIFWGTGLTLCSYHRLREGTSAPGFGSLSPSRNCRSPSRCSAWRKKIEDNIEVVYAANALDDADGWAGDNVLG